MTPTGKGAGKVFRAAGREWTGERPLLIAEIGTGHGGDRGKARELIAAAAESGASCAKFQMVYADEIIHPLTGTVPLPGGDIPLYERFRSLELPPDFFAACKEETERRGLVFLCTPFGKRSAAELSGLGVSCMKVASPELNHLPLLDAIAVTGLPALLSSGVSTLADIETALSRFPGEKALLHCVTAYPAPEEDYNLRLLPSLSALFGVPAGVSDHSLDPLLVPLLSLAMGACIVEKHFCLSRADGGLDDPIALDPPAFSLMARGLGRAAALSSEEILSWAGEEYGRERVDAVLGDGVKRLAPSEEANYERTNRSLHALKGFKKGEILGEGGIAILRTEKILRPGLPPSFLPRVIGRLAARDIPPGEGIVWEDLGGFPGGDSGNS